MREALHLDLPVLGLELVGTDAQHRRRDLEQDVLGLFGRELDRVAGHIGRAAGDGARIHGRRIGIRRNHMHVIGGDAEFLRGDLAEDGERALARFHGAGDQGRGAVLIDLHRRRRRVGHHGKPDRVPHAAHAFSALFHWLSSFQPNRSAAFSRESLTTTLCST